MHKKEDYKMEQSRKSVTFTLSNDAVEHLKALKERKHVNLSAYVDALILVDKKGDNDAKI